MAIKRNYQSTTVALMVIFFMLRCYCCLPDAKGLSKSREHILLLTHSRAPSHVRIFHNLAETLQKRGHLVTVLTCPISSTILEVKVPAGVNVVQMETDHKEFDERLERMTTEWAWIPADNIWLMLDIIVKMIQAAVKPCFILDRDAELRKTLRSLNVTFGVLDPQANACTQVICNFINIPYIAYSPALTTYGMDQAVGTPCPFSYVPNYWQDVSAYQEGVIRRAVNTFGHFIFDFLMKATFAVMTMFIPTTNKWELVSPSLPKLLLDNTNSFLEVVRPHAPAHLHTKHPPAHQDAEIPEFQDIKLFVESEESEGTVVFSMTSVMRSAAMPDRVKNAFLEAFKRFPNYRFIWRLEPAFKETDVNDNIKTMPWIPQPGLLADPKTKVLITHGGLNTIQEAVGNGVPMLSTTGRAIPMFGDQHPNAAVVVQKQYGLVLKKIHIQVDVIETLLRELLQNTSYRTQVKRTAEMTRECDRLRRKADDVVWLLEYALRWKEKLDIWKPRGAALSTIRYFNLDIFLLLFIQLFLWLEIML